MKDSAEIAQLQEFNNNNLSALINSTGNAMWSVDKDFGLITSNKSFNDIVNLLSGGTNGIAAGENVLALGFPREQSERYKTYYERAFAGEAFTEIEFTDNPIEYWSQISFNPIKRGNEIVGTACYAHDITEIKQVEKRIQESEAFAHGIFNSLESHIAVINESGEIVAANESWNQFGLQNGETSLQSTGIGSNYYEVCEKAAKAGEKISKRVLKAFKDVLKREKASYYFEYPCHSPHEQQWFAMRVLKFESNSPLVIVTHTDITERKLAEENLVVAYDKLNYTLNDLKKIMDSSSDIICTIDGDGKFVSVSAASKRILGYGPEELEGRTFMEFVFGDDVEKSILAAQDVMGGASFTLFQNRYVNKQGNVVPLIWSARWDATDQIMYCIAKDATEKKNLEKALDAERQRFFDIFLHAPTIMGLLMGPEHIFEIANPPCLQLIGKKDVVGKSMAEVMPEVVTQGFIELLDDVYTTGNPFVGNEILLSIDKEGDGKFTFVYLNLIYHPYRNSEGAIEGIFFYGVDVTQQAVSRKIIEESESRLKEAQSLAKVGNWETDMVTLKVEWSAETYRIFDIQSDEFYPSHAAFLNFVHPDDRQEVADAFDNSYGDKSIHTIEHRIITNDGTLKFVEERWQIFHNTKDIPIKAVGTCQDVTERKRSEHENKFKAVLLDTIGQAVIAADINGNVTFWNKAAVEIYGWSVEEAIGNNILDLTPTVHSKSKASTTVKKLSKGASWSGEFYVKRKNGSIFPAFVFNSPVYDGFGKQIGIIGVSNDISERKEFELERLKITNDLLQRNRDLEQFTFIISHNLRAPIANIIGFSEILLNETLTPVEHMDLLQGMQTTVIGLDVTIKDVNAILQVKKEVSEKKEIISFSKLTNDISVGIGTIVDQRHVNIITDFSETDEIFTLKVYMHSIFYNLITNSIKYCKPNVNPIIEIKSQVQNGKIILSFKDNGLGIDMKTKGDKVFGLYKRFHSHVEGKGMGLFMVKTHVEALGGKITVASALNKGTAFTITFDKIRRT